MVGFNENELTFAATNVYPNPANDVVNVSVKGIQTLPLTINLMDVSGRTLSSQTFHSASVEAAINTAELKSGIYFIQLSSQAGSKTVKVLISK
jgi:hypothetical protein